MVLVDWVLEYWMKGELIEARDKRMGGDFAAVEVEVELVLRLGCLCSLPEAASRPSMRQVVQYLERNLPLPEISVCNLSAFNSSTPNHRLVVDVSSTISDGAPISDPPS
ncbi:hypothetical protein HPP92_003037 [Vanilla planifolia]|uniref:Uncharacterized protein n=1 Tax=Vanilla planifolia TaxID=51239 RepID=A0A835S9L3_VANPL|nr:hypothetical protein HPP92_003037 [Vanilla planifolia]